MEKIEFKELNNKIEMDNNLLIVFSSEWCGQCKMTKLLIEKVKSDYPNLVFVEINVDDNNLWENEKLNIKSIPTFVGYKNKEQSFNTPGYQTEENLREILNTFN